MKTAISIPDPIFNEAEELAKKLGMNRSEFYSQAVVKLISQYRDEEITERLNEVYEQEESHLDPVLKQLQTNAINIEEW